MKRLAIFQHVPYELLGTLDPLLRTSGFRIRYINFGRTLEAFLADVTDILKDEVDELVRCGATYIQLDAPHYPLLLDSRFRRFYESRGWTREKP